MIFNFSKNNVLILLKVVVMMIDKPETIKTAPEEINLDTLTETIKR